MPVSATYIAVIILLLILIGFILIVIRTLTNTASNTIRNDMNKLLNSYDYIINGKLEEIRKLDKSLVQKQTNIMENKKAIRIDNIKKDSNETHINASVFVKNEISHRDTSLIDSYDSIRNVFDFYREEMTKRLTKINDNLHTTKYSNSIKELVKLITPDVVYELSLMNNESQYNFLKDILNEDYKEILKQYREMNNEKKFSIIEFRDWLNTESLKLEDRVVIRSGYEKNDKTDYEPSICEGYQILVGDKLYDYSISKRDIQ